MCLKFAFYNCDKNTMNKKHLGEEKLFFSSQLIRNQEKSAQEFKTRTCMWRMAKISETNDNSC